jgi:hypothetical protein
VICPAVRVAGCGGDFKKLNIEAKVAEHNGKFIATTAIEAEIF